MLHRVKVAKPPPAFVSDDLNNLFDLERRENENAIIIQKTFRRSRVLVPWRRAVLCQKMAIKIQTMVRAVVARKWVARWFHIRNTLVVRWQGCIRKWISNRHARPKLHVEKLAATTIQRTVRGKLGRVRWYRIRSNMAAKHIQSLWRGIVARSYTDRMWLNRVIVPIQTHVRCMLAKIKCKTNRKELDRAAAVIQHKYLSWYSQNKVGNTLFARELAYRTDQIDYLRNDEDWSCTQILKMAERLEKRSVRADLNVSAEVLQRGYDEVYRLQQEFLETGRQKELLSPRAIQQGWRPELERKTYLTDLELTNQKLKVLFDYIPPVLKLEAQLESKVSEIERMAEFRDAVSIFRDEEYLERRETTYWKDVLARRKQKRQEIADEKRMWEVKWCSRNGKPDRKRRPGRPWDKSILAGPNRDTYCPTKNVDLFANERDKEDLRPGSEKSVEDTIGKLSLQTYLDQVQTYETLLDPISKIMENTTCAPPTTFDQVNRVDVVKPAPEDLGYGPIGKELAPAMWKIGAAPASFHRPLSPGGTTIASPLSPISPTLTNMSDMSELPDVILPSRRRLSSSSSAPQTIVTQSVDGALRPRKKSIISELRLPTGGKKSSTKKLKEVALTPAQIKHQEMIEKRRKRRKDRKDAEHTTGSATVIPWALLDQLDGEKLRFESEKSYVDFSSKF